MQDQKHGGGATKQHSEWKTTQEEIETKIRFIYSR